MQRDCVGGVLTWWHTHLALSSAGRVFALVGAATLYLVMAICSAGPHQFAAADPSGFIGEATTSPARADEVEALLRALKSGDAVAVNALADEIGLNAISRALLNAQLRYDVPQLLVLAKQCRAMAFARRLLRVAVRCNGIAFGAAQVLGNAHEMLHLLAWVKRVGFPAETQLGQSKSARIAPGFDAVDAASLVNRVSTLRAAVSAPQGELPVVNWRQKQLATTTNTVYAAAWTSPQVAIAVNGHLVHARIDTGAMLPLTIGASEATKLGVETLVTGLTAIPTLNEPSTTPGNAALGLVKRFRFGPLTIHNLAVEIVPDAYVDRLAAVVGFPVLARFRRVLFTRTAVTVSMRERGCADQLPMTYAASGTNQIGHPVFFASTGTGKRVSAMFDSGLTTLLLAGAKLAGRSHVPKPGAVLDNARRGYLALTIAGGQVSSYDAAFAPVFHGPPDVLVGIPLLATANVTIAFSPLALCVEPAVALHSRR